MYFLNNDGTLISDDGGNRPIKTISENPIEIDIISSSTEIHSDVVEPHDSGCKCVKCFVKHKLRGNFTYTNIFSVITFLIIVYIIYMLLLRVFM